MPPPPPPERMPVDEGYAWVICAGSAMAFFVTMGVPKSLGVMLIEFQDHFQSDPGVTSLTVALVVAGFFMFVFFSNTLGFIFGNRNIAVGGAVMAAISMFATAFAPNIYFVVIFLGLFSGMAYSALFGPPLVILSAYFKKRRALATGLAVGGGSLGQLSIPLLFNFLVEYYGFQGGMMIFSGVILNALPACLLLRPPDWWSRPPKVKKVNDAESGDEPAPPKPGYGKKFSTVMKIMLDKELFKSHIFQMLVCSIILAHMGYFAAVIFLPSAANSFFNNRTLSVVLVSVMGMCDLVGRLMGGYIADLRVIPINDLMGISLVVPGIATMFAGLFPSIWLSFVAAILLGCFAGSYTALLTPVIIEYFGLSKVSPGFGILTFSMGLFMAPWPTILAIIFKTTGSYKPVLAISGAVCALGGIMFFLMRFVIQKERKKEEKRKAKEESQNPYVEVEGDDDDSDAKASDDDDDDDKDDNDNKSRGEDSADADSVRADDVTGSRDKVDDVNKNDIALVSNSKEEPIEADGLRDSLLPPDEELEAMEAVV